MLNNELFMIFNEFLKTFREKDLKHVKKSAVLDANHNKFNALGKRLTKNKDLDVSHVVKHLFGNSHMLKNVMNNNGSNFGSKKAIRSDSYVICQAIVMQNSNESKTIGLINLLLKIWTILLINIYSLMEHTFIKKVA